MTWGTVGVLAGLFAGLGYALDRWSLRRQKHVVYDRLIAWWNRLDDTSVPDLPRRMAEWSLGVWHKIAGLEFFSVRALGVSLGASCVLTTIALYGGAAIGEGGWGSPLGLGEAIRLTAFYGINAIFDTATILVTLHAIRIVRDRSGKMGVLAMIGDVAFAYTCAVVCGVTILAFNYAGQPRAWRTYFAGGLDLVHTGVGYWFGYQSEWLLRYGLFVSTTLLPTFVWSTLLLFLTFAKLVLTGAKRVGLFFLERATEDEVPTFKPFTLLGSVFASIALVAKTVQHFVG